MRPRKVILCVDQDEDALGRMKFLLETRGYSVLAETGTSFAWDVLRMATPGQIDLVLWQVERTDGAELMEAVQKANVHRVKVMMLSRTVKVYPGWARADCFLPAVVCFPANILENVRVLVARKRGPKSLRAAVPTAPETTAKPTMEACA